jgi:hypothetical protein
MPTTKPRSPLALLAAPVVAVTVVAGVWLAGGVITNDFRTSMALAAVWFAVSGVTCALIARRWRAIRIPVLAAFVLTAGALGAYLATTTLRDRVVHEHVVTAIPATHARAGQPPHGPIDLSRGRFRPNEHATAGIARVVRAPDGRRLLTLTAFSTSPGPDLRVRLVPGDSIDGGAKGATDLGGLKGNRGDQQYVIPANAEAAGRTVVIWCRAFSAPFGSAMLNRVT